MPTARLRRSCLAVPGSSEKMIAKASGLSADEVFLDLEDSVAPDEKNDRTRDRIVDAVNGLDWYATTLTVRVNAVGTPWCLDDICHLIDGAGSKLDCLMLPKVDDASQVHFVHHLLDTLERRSHRSSPIGLEVQIESPRGLLELEAIAASSDRIQALIFGPGDYAASAGIPQLSVGAIDPKYPGDQWHYVLSKIQTVARAFGMQAIDGPYAQIKDAKGYREVAMRSRSLGFDGKWALHPDQITICNEVYSPTNEEYERATKILSAYKVATEERRLGAVAFDGEMIDEASKKMAEQIAARGNAARLPSSEDAA